MDTNKLKVDYSKIASSYDKGKDRGNVIMDEALASMVKIFPNEKILVLDLGCGTGAYTFKQQKEFIDHNIEWHALDPSAAMLDIMRSKLKNVKIKSGYAESLPFDDNSMHYVMSHFSFHHFLDKKKAVGEIFRVLKKDGAFSFVTIAPRHMKAWWIYQFFPMTYDMDMQRFPTEQEYIENLFSDKFDLDVKVNVSYKHENLSYLYDCALNRDISQLNMIDDETYNNVLKNMKEKLNKEPKTVVLDEFAMLSATARKK